MGKFRTSPRPRRRFRGKTRRSLRGQSSNSRSNPSISKRLCHTPSPLPFRWRTRPGTPACLCSGLPRRVSFCLFRYTFSGRRGLLFTERVSRTCVGRVLDVCCTMAWLNSQGNRSEQSNSAPPDSGNAHRRTFFNQLSLGGLFSDPFERAVPQVRLVPPSPPVLRDPPEPGRPTRRGR